MRPQKEVISHEGAKMNQLANPNGHCTGPSQGLLSIYVVTSDNLIYSYTYVHVVTPDRVSASDTSDPGSKHIDIHFFLLCTWNEKKHIAQVRNFPQVSAVRMSHSQAKHHRNTKACIKNLIHKTFHVGRLMNTINKMMSQ